MNHLCILYPRIRIHQLNKKQKLILFSLPFVDSSKGSRAGTGRDHDRISPDNGTSPDSTATRSPKTHSQTVCGAIWTGSGSASVLGGKEGSGRQLGKTKIFMLASVKYFKQTSL